MVILGGNISPAISDAETALNVIKVDEQDHYHEDWIPPFQLRESVRIKTNEKFGDYYELYEEIGEGKFGKVYRCVERETNLVLAAKCIRLKRDADLQKVEKEVNIMTQMRHKCIAQIYDAFATFGNNDVILIMEIVQGGELFDRVVDENYILTEMAVAMIIHQICEAIRYIHSQNIIHLDLKPENIMCVSQMGNQIKLIDFGLAQYFDGQSDLLFMAGTPEFAAPEVIKYEPLDFHTDMWSVGVITYILLSGQSPFLGENVAHTYCNVERGKWEFCEEFRENGITPEAQDFISHLLVVDKHKRMLPAECLQHPWIKLFRERSRSNHAAVEKPLDIGKLRSYIRNKRFRRLVFGVLFVNTIVRMMSTLQEKKSQNGIEYVKNMLSAVKEDDTSDSEVNNANSGTEGLMKVLFSKRKRSDPIQNKENITASTSMTISLASTKKEHIPTETAANTTLIMSSTTTTLISGGVKKKIDASRRDDSDRLSKSHSGEELYRRAKRLNRTKDAHIIEGNKIKTRTTITLDSTQSSCSNEKQALADTAASSAEENLMAINNESAHSKKNEKKSKRVKDASRKASSTEQAPQKRTKTSTSTSDLRLEQEDYNDVSCKNNLTCSPQGSNVPKNISPKTSRPRSPNMTVGISKLKNLAMFEQKGAVPFQVGVVINKTDKHSISEVMRKTSNASPTKIVVTNTDNQNIIKMNNTKIENKIGPTSLKKKTNETNKDNKELDETRKRILSATKVSSTSPIKVKHELTTGYLTHSSTSNSPTSSLKTPEKDEIFNKIVLSKSANSRVSKKASLSLSPVLPRKENVKELEIKVKNSSRSKSPIRSRNNKIRNHSSERKIETISDEKNLVNSMLKKLEKNDTSSSALKMAVSGFVPRTKSENKSTTLRRYDSADNLLNNKINKGKLLESENAYKISTVTFKVDTNHNRNLEKLVNTKTKISPLKFEIKNEQKTTIKNNGENLLKDEPHQLLTKLKLSLRKASRDKSHDSLKANHDPITTNGRNEKTCIILKKKIFEISSDCSTDIVENIKHIPAKQRPKSSTLTAETEAHNQKVENSATNKVQIVKKVLRKGSSSSSNDIALKTENNIKSILKVGNIDGDQKEQCVSLQKKLILRPKKKMSKKLSINGKDKKQKSTCSLNDLVSNKEGQNVTFASHEVLINETNQPSKCAQTTAKEISQQPPRSENDLTKGKLQNNLQRDCLSSQTRSLAEKAKRDDSRRNSSTYSFEYDAFDFSALRLKLQQRILGVKDEEIATETENRHRCELRVQLHDPAAIQQTRNKWLDMDRATKAQ